MKKIITYISSICIILSSCSEYLDLKPDDAISTPETLEDLEAMLSYESKMNENYCGLVEIGADDYQLVRSVFDGRTVFERDNFRWENDPLYLQLDMGENWQRPYETILYSNIVLESLERIKGGDITLRNKIKGDALFVRAYRFFNLAQAFSPVYDPSIENSNLGIPLRLSSDVSEKTTRSTVKQTYDQILSDLMESANLLPEKVGNKTRPDKAAAFALLSRVLLSMQNYEGALEAATKCMALNNTLIDYNNIDLTKAFPFSPLNSETLYYGKCPISLLLPTRADVSFDLYNRYDSKDLRKKAFFSMRTPQRIRFKGYYNGGSTGYFAGIAIDEVYLNAAESNIRLGKFKQGLNLLNTLLKNRYESGTYIEKFADNETEALHILLEERRKELPFRGTRWTDIRRLNLDTRFATNIRHTIYGTDEEDVETFVLTPNDNRFVFLIPQSIIELTGIPQNKR